MNKIIFLAALITVLLILAVITSLIFIPSKTDRTITDQEWERWIRSCMKEDDDGKNNDDQ